MGANGYPNGANEVFNVLFNVPACIPAAAVRSSIGSCVYKLSSENKTKKMEFNKIFDRHNADCAICLCEMCDRIPSISYTLKIQNVHLKPTIVHAKPLANCLNGQKEETVRE